MLSFTGSNPKGQKAKVRKSKSPWENGFSVFTWSDNGTGVILWRETHELSWDDAYKTAQDWLK